MLIFNKFVKRGELTRTIDKINKNEVILSK